MKALCCLAGVVFITVGANAGDGVLSSELDTVAKPVVEQKLDVPEYSPSQILCVKQRREGSRVRETRCQTLADWKRDIELKNMRSTLARASGKTRAWEFRKP